MSQGFPTRPGLYQAATNADIVFTLRPDPSRRHVLPGVHFSYDADPTGAFLLIEILDPDAVGGTTYRTIGKHFITKGGPGPLEFVRPYETAVNTGMRVTLKAGGSGINATLELVGYQLGGL